MSQWTLLAHNGLEYGPVEEEELISWIRERRVSADDLVTLHDPEGHTHGARAGCKVPRQWELVGEAEDFSSYFKNRPTETGRIKKVLKNKNEELKELLKKAEEKRSRCEECSFMEGVERLHEEKKILEEKLAEDRGRLQELERWKKT